MKHKILLVIALIIFTVFACQSTSNPTAGNQDASNQTSEPVSLPTATELPSELIDAFGVPMVLIPEGEFTMGRNAEDILAECKKYSVDCKLDWFKDAEPPHQVYLDVYFIDKYEVTKGQYRNCVVAGACETVTGVGRLMDSQEENYPVTWISWSKADNYCKWRGAELPTEAQWEKAARGTDGRTYPWGEEEISCDKANYGTCVRNSAEVGSFEGDKSPYGAYDMAGNVSEIVADWYSDTYYQISPASNPLGPESGEFKVKRGGSWGAYELDEQLMIRSGYSYTDEIGTNGVGFRCAISPSAISQQPTMVMPTEIAITSSDSYSITYITDDFDVQMAFVPEGEFTMGKVDITARQVYLDAFYIDKYEVTNELYKACVDAQKCSPPQETNINDPQLDYYGKAEFANYPVVNVSWNQSSEYCEWRGGHLPTEAQWEKAARGTDARTYPWGEELSCDLANVRDCQANYGTKVKVGSYENGKSPYGVYDMAGNVTEWVEDWYMQYDKESLSYKNPIAPEPGPDYAKNRVVRGYSDTFGGGNSDPKSNMFDLGFRCAKEATP